MDCLWNAISEKSKRKIYTNCNHNSHLLLHYSTTTNTLDIGDRYYVTCKDKSYILHYDWECNYDYDISFEELLKFIEKC